MNKNTKIMTRYLIAAAMIALVIGAVFLTERPAKNVPEQALAGVADKTLEKAEPEVPETVVAQMPEQPDAWQEASQPSQEVQDGSAHSDRPDVSSVPEELPRQTNPAEETEAFSQAPQQGEIQPSESLPSEPVSESSSGVPGAESAPNELPQEPEDPLSGAGVVPGVPEQTVFHATLSVTCQSLVDAASLDPDKKELVPSDGVIFPETVVEFYPGESVFHLLSREMRKNGIHMEFVSTSAYRTSYVEGIGNLYEFDAGELSGWMFRVNGLFPQQGCSSYLLSDGDVVEWVYTCDLGKDIGAEQTVEEAQKNDD